MVNGTDLRVRTWGSTLTQETSGADRLHDVVVSKGLTGKKLG